LAAALSLAARPLASASAARWPATDACSSETQTSTGPRAPRRRLSSLELWLAPAAGTRYLLPAAAVAASADCLDSSADAAPGDSLPPPPQAASKDAAAPSVMALMIRPTFTSSDSGCCRRLLGTVLIATRCRAGVARAHRGWQAGDVDLGDRRASTGVTARCVGQGIVLGGCNVSAGRTRTTPGIPRSRSNCVDEARTRIELRTCRTRATSAMPRLRNCSPTRSCWEATWRWRCWASAAPTAAAETGSLRSIQTSNADLSLDSAASTTKVIAAKAPAINQRRRAAKDSLLPTQTICQLPPSPWRRGKPITVPSRRASAAPNCLPLRGSTTTACTEPISALPTV
jgi:hypothetical protein